MQSSAGSAFSPWLGRSFCERAGGKKRAEWGGCPRSARRRERSGEPREQVGFGTSGGEGETRPLAVSMTQLMAQTQVANSALARSRVVGMASRTVSISQWRSAGRGAPDWRLADSARVVVGGRAASCAAWDQVLGLTARNKGCRKAIPPSHARFQKRMSSPSRVASKAVMARRSLSQDLALCRVS